MPVARIVGELSVGNVGKFLYYVREKLVLKFSDLEIVISSLRE
jgi:hypothetical protein